MHLTVCHSVRLYLSELLIVHDSDQFLSDLPQIWNVGHACDNEDQVRWPI